MQQKISDHLCYQAQKSRRDPDSLKCGLTEVAFGVKWIICLLLDMYRVENSIKQIGAILVSQTCCNKISQTGYLKTTESYSFIALEASSLQSGRAMLSSKALEQNPCLFQLWQSQVLLGLWWHNSSLYFCLHTTVFLFCLPSSYKDINHIGLRIHPAPV